MRTRSFAVFATILGLCAAGPASGQLNNGQQQSMVAAHVQTHDTKGLKCSNWNPDMPCDQFVINWPLGVGADVYFIIANADSALGVSGVSLGVDYGNTPGVQADGQGCDVFGYLSCADLEYTNGIDMNDTSTEFPSAGGGNRLIWVRTTNCQRHVVPYWQVEALACVFYVYAYGPDQFTVDMNRNLMTGPEFEIVDCPGPALSDMAWPSHAGVVGFGTNGYNPCGSGDDFYPPTLVSASGIGTTNLVTVQFSEGVFGSDTSYYTVYPTADPSSPLAVTDVTIVGSVATLTLASNLVSGVAYTVAVTNVRDYVGHPLAGNSTVSFVATVPVPTERTTWGRLKTQYR